MANANGRVVQILGGVVDVEFAEHEIPDLFEAIEVERPGQKKLVLEVQKHIGNGWVRTVAMDTTDGLQRGMPAVSTGAPIMVPVGLSTLGRIFNVLGQPVDEKGDVECLPCTIPFIALRLHSLSNPPAWKFSKPASKLLT